LAGDTTLSMSVEFPPHVKFVYRLDLWRIPLDVSDDSPSILDGPCTHKGPPVTSDMRQL